VNGKCVVTSNADRDHVRVPYDYLVIASGATHSYFGHNEFEAYAPGMKSLADAVASRNKILQAFEQAEAEEDPTRHRDLLTFVLVGAGPTGVEMAGALAVMVRTTLRSEFRRIDPASARIVLVDMSPRVLSPFTEKLSAAAKHRLEELGVEVRLGHSVEQIDADGIVVAGERIASKTVIWTAGVAPSPAGKWLNVPTDRAGRVVVQRIVRLLAIPSSSWSATRHHSSKTANRCRGWHKLPCKRVTTLGSSSTGAFEEQLHRNHFATSTKEPWLWWGRVCRAPEREGAVQRLLRLVHLGLHPPAVPGDLESACERPSCSGSGRTSPTSAVHG